MSLHLAEISQAVAPRAHAVVLMDQAGWHTTDKLDVPANITIIPLPAKCPELNPVENIWQFMRDNWLSNRVFTSHDNIIDHCCEAWNKLVDQPWHIMTTTDSYCTSSSNVGKQGLLVFHFDATRASVTRKLGNLVLFQVRSSYLVRCIRHNLLGWQDAFFHQPTNTMGRGHQAFWRLRSA